MKYFLSILCLFLLLFTLFSCDDESDTPTPSITSLNPNNCMTRSEQFTMTVNGTNFTNDAVVLFNNNQLATTYVNANQLTAVVATNNTAVSLESSPYKLNAVNDTTINIQVRNSIGTSNSSSFTLYSNWNFASASTIGSGEGVLGDDPQIVEDTDGNLYAVWLHYEYTSTVQDNYYIKAVTAAEIRFSKSTDAGQSWTTPKKISGSQDLKWANPSPSIAIDNKNVLRVMWRGYQGGSGNYLYFCWSTDKGNNWADPVRLAQQTSGYSTLEERQPTFFVEPSTSNLHAAWVGWTKSYNYAVFYANTINTPVTLDRSITAFSTPAQLCTASSSNLGDTYVIADSRGNVHVAWSKPSADYMTREIYMVSSTNNGTSFGNPVRLATSSQTNQWYPDPSMALDSNGALYTVYTGPFSVTAFNNENGNISATGSNIMFTKSTNHGTSFSTAKSITSSAGAAVTPYIACDSLNNLTVVYQDMGSAKSTIYAIRSTDGGETFSSPAQVAQADMHIWTSGLYVNSFNVDGSMSADPVPLGRLNFYGSKRPVLAFGSYFGQTSSDPGMSGSEVFRLYFSFGKSTR